MIKVCALSSIAVIIAKRAADASCIIRDREYEIVLILAEGYLPGMDKYELLETMKKMSKVPVVLMSVDYNGNAMLGGLFKGAIFYLIKPVTMDDLKYLWQFAFMKERENLPAMEEISGIEEESSLENASGVDVVTQPLINEGRQNLQNGKRKTSDEMQNNEEDNGDSAARKKPKRVWTNELHNRFLQAIKVLGIDAHVPSQHVLSPFSHQEGFQQFPDMQAMTAAVQENLSGCVPIHFPWFSISS
ncbi:hypothetical protein PTKIN_Ptkin12aG0189800 [Pterospermum kingtungense]